jgi:curved DNA-binding protein CbpA
MPINPYIILGVSENASLEEIHTAYFKLAKTFHPDINKSASANSQMQAINEAYDILKDAEKRKSYDYIYGQKDLNEAPIHERKSENFDFVRCQKCGVIDHTLRITAFPYVISFVLVTLKRGWGGIYCEDCRKEEMAKARLISLFLGWWGFPWGFIYTLECLFMPNGKIPEQPNSQLLKILGMYLFSIGDIFGAKSALEQSYAINKDEEVFAIKEKIKNYSGFEIKKRKQPKPALFMFRLVVASLIIIPISIGLFQDFNTNGYSSSSINTNAPNYNLNIPADVLNLPTIEPTNDFSKWVEYESIDGKYLIKYPAHYEIDITNDGVTFFTDYPTLETDQIIYYVILEKMDFNISYSDLDNAVINNLQNEFFINNNFKVFKPLEKELVYGYPALTGAFKKVFGEIPAIQYVTFIFKNNNVFTLIALGPEELSEIETYFLIFKNSLIF